MCACVHVHWGTPFSLARSFSPDSRRHVDQSENSKGEGTDGVVASIPPPPPPLIPQGRRRRRSALLFAPSRRRPPRRWPSSVATAVRDVPAFVSVSSVYRPGRCCGRGCRPNSLASGPASRASLPLTPPIYTCVDDDDQSSSSSSSSPHPFAPFSYSRAVVSPARAEISSWSSSVAALKF